MLSKTFTVFCKQIIRSHQNPFHISTLCLLTFHSHTCGLYLVVGVNNMTKLNLLTLSGKRVTTNRSSESKSAWSSQLLIWLRAGHQRFLVPARKELKLSYLPDQNFLRQRSMLLHLNSLFCGLYCYMS